MKIPRITTNKLGTLKKTQEDMTKLLKQQLVIVRSTLGTINSTLIDMEYNQEKVKNGLVQIK
jgi:dethiobiotin synthetase